MVATPLYPAAMPNAPRTPARQFRCPDADWTDFQRAAAARGTERAALLREFIAWYISRPGAKRPTRPDPSTWQTQAPADDN